MHVESAHEVAVLDTHLEVFSASTLGSHRYEFLSPLSVPGIIRITHGTTLIRFRSGSSTVGAATVFMVHRRQVVTPLLPVRFQDTAHLTDFSGGGDDNTRSAPDRSPVWPFSQVSQVTCDSAGWWLKEVPVSVKSLLNLLACEDNSWGGRLAPAWRDRLSS